MTTQEVIDTLKQINLEFNKLPSYMAEVLEKANKNDI